MFLFNTLTGKKEKFAPLDPGGKKVGLYVCGITPYDESHIGHARCYVVFDILKRALLANGYQVTHVQNFTDVDDKIIKRANELGQPSETFPKPYMESFKRYMGQLNVLPADNYPLVTTHMQEIVELIGKLVKRGFAYELDGSVYYSVRKFGAAYGKLSNRNVDELESGARVEVDERKKDPLDFALWKKSKEGEPFWKSPWGNGRPGWHIECSAMSMKYLGENFDIHGGGMDLIFPHHTNEIAQSEGATGKKFANVWVHNGFVTIDNEKMSKSLGNFFTIKDVLAKFDPMVVRYFLLSTHYRSPLNFSDQALSAAAVAWNQRILGAYRISSSWNVSIQDPSKYKNGPWIKDFQGDGIKNFMDALSNDLNTPDALAEINNLCSQVYEGEKSRKPVPEAKGMMDAMFHTLGLVPAAEEKWSDEILALAHQREAARKNKEWKKSDELRDALKAKGVLIEDTPSGYRLKKLGGGIGVA